MDALTNKVNWLYDEVKSRSPNSQQVCEVVPLNQLQIKKTLEALSDLIENKRQILDITPKSPN